MPDLPQLELAAFPQSITLPVQWGDQDLFGHVNNTVFFRWFESARIAYLDRIGLGEMAARRKIGPILAAIGCNYRRQLKFPDTVDVGARITRIGRSSISMEHAVFSREQNALVADGQSTIVSFDYAKNESCPVPDEIRQAIERLEGRSL